MRGRRRRCGSRRAATTAPTSRSTAGTCSRTSSRPSPTRGPTSTAAAWTTACGCRPRCCGRCGRRWGGTSAAPEMPKKVGEGRLDDVRVCVGAAEGCIGRLRQGKAITCIQNPVIGREAELMDIHPASSRRRVVVVGGGVAGLEAARVAALRGHQTILLEATSAVGGQVLAVARAPKREAYASLPAWLAGQARKAGVEIRLNTRASGADVLTLRPDAVILATGATQRVPDIPGVTLPHVASTVDVLTGRVTPGRRVVLV